MRILDIITHTAGRIIGLGDNGFLYWACPQHDDAFQALKRATINPGTHKWLLWDIGAGEDIEEIAVRLKERCLRDHSFPYRTKTLQPA